MTCCDICGKPIKTFGDYTLTTRGPRFGYYSCCSEKCLHEVLAREGLDIEENTRKSLERAARLTKAARILTSVNAAIVILQLLLWLIRTQ